MVRRVNQVRQVRQVRLVRQVAWILILLTSAVGAFAHAPVAAQSPDISRFAIFWRGARIGSENVTVIRGADGWIIPGEAAFALSPRLAKPSEPEAPRLKTGKPPERRRKK